VGGSKRWDNKHECVVNNKKDDFFPPLSNAVENVIE
jgi:hypothetical protein